MTHVRYDGRLQIRRGWYGTLVFDVDLYEQVHKLREAAWAAFSEGRTIGTSNVKARPLFQQYHDLNGQADQLLRDAAAAYLRGDHLRGEVTS
jgi:hypothetical protein